nr:CdiA family toxin C-terminal domain-containing protein [Bacillus mycoides]
MLEGLIGAAGSTISGAATGVIKSVYLVLELGELGINKIRGVETEQWKLDDLDATWEGTKKLAEYGIVGYITTKAPHLSKFLNNPELTDKIPVLDNLARTYRKDEKEMYNAVKDYVEKAMTDPYAFGGMIFDIGSFCVGVGEVAAVVNGGKIAEGANLFQAAGKSDKIVGKSEEVAALTNKLPGMKNALEKIRNMEIRDLSPETSAAGVGSVEERKTLGELFSAFKSGTKGTGNLKIKESYYVEHTTGPVEKFTERNGISGGHNYDEFENYFNSSSNKYELGPVVKKEHPDINGIFDIEYKVKYEKMDYTGKNGTGEYKVIPNGDKVYKKTVYDPKIISSDEIIALSKKAMEEGLNNKREIPLLKQKKIKIQGQADYNGKNLKFEGIMNSETGEIENAYPVLDWVD